MRYNFTSIYFFQKSCTFRHIYIYIYKRRKRETRKGKMKQNKEKKEKGLMKEKQRYNYLLHLYWDAMYKTGLPRS